MLIRNDLELLALVAPIVWAIYKYGLKPFFKHVIKTVQGMHKISEISEALKQLAAAVDDLKLDLRPNGGSSLRDAVDRVESVVILNQNTQKAILDLLNSGFFLTDAEGEFVHVNLHWQYLTGINVIDAMGHGWILAVHPDDRVELMEQWDMAVEDGRPFHKKFRIQHVGKHTIKTVYCHTAPLHDLNGVLVGYVGTLMEAD